jgi:hypothetical protein
MRAAAVAALIALLPALAIAQPAASSPDMTAQKEALQKGAWLVGSWEGRGWVDTPEGRMTFRQTETVEARLGGLLIALEGRGYSGTPETLAFNAFGVLSYDDRSKRYTLRSWTRGYVTDGAAEFRDDGALVWSMTPPGQVIRYTITQPQPGRWREIGERSAGGAPFTQFFEMELTKK